MRLPQVAKRPQRGERPSMATVRPTDLGLGVAAQETHAWQEEVRRTQDVELEVQRETDWRAVEPELKGLQERFEARFAEAGAQWDGIEPGFARRIGTALDDEIAPLLARDDLSPGQKDALSRGLSQYREATGQRAIQYQAQRRGQQAAEAQAAREAVAVGSVMAGYVEAFGARKTQRDNDYDGSTPDYVEGVLADHDAVAEGLIAAAPEALRPRVTQQLAARRLQLQGQAMDFEARAEQGFLAGQVRTAGSQLVNGVLSAPTMYETAVAEVDQTLAALPRAARGEARAGLLNDLTEAYVSGLIREKQHDQALTLLNGGSLDGRLKPDAKARLLASAERSRDGLDVDDWVARMRLQNDIQDDLASRAATGQGTGVDPAAIATMLGPREAAEYQLAVEQAGEAHRALSGYAQMTPAQIREHVAAQAPVPGQAGFADAQRRYAAAQQAADAEIKAREDDPAGWAMRQATSLQGALQALGTGDPARARREAGSYGVAQLTLQETAGVPASERRILPKAAATSLVNAAVTNPDRAQGLLGLGAVVEAFAPPAGADGRAISAAMARQRMVINELKAAGADNGDLAAALDLAGDPVRMGRYVAATRRGALDGMEKRDKTAVEETVDRELTPYLRSFEGMPVSAALTGGRRLMAHRLAADAVANGASVREAAREAAGIVSDGYVFVGPAAWRMPRTVADRREPGPAVEFGRTAVQRGASAVMRGLTRNAGEGFYAPADQGRGLTEAQRRERYADSLTRSGRWTTTPDDQGLILMQPTLDGGWTPALDRGGRSIVRTWDQLREAGRPQRAAPAATGGGGRQSGAPRGVRNNNPGNIEHRSNIRWQGQTGHDGRFARFETPEQGLRALSRDLGTKIGRGQNTIQTILAGRPGRNEGYAPPSDNNTAAYVRAVSRALGLDPNAPIAPDDVRTRAGLIAAIVQHENGQQPYSNALIVEAARQGMRR